MLNELSDEQGVAIKYIWRIKKLVTGCKPCGFTNGFKIG